jgi:hypothetical protein
MLYVEFMSKYLTPLCARHMPQASLSGEFPSGKQPTTRVRLRISRLSRLIAFLVRIKDAGEIISHSFGSAMRSILIGIYELNIEEVLVIGHTDCGARCTDSKNLIEKMKVRGITQKNY